MYTPPLVASGSVNPAEMIWSLACTFRLPDMLQPLVASCMVFIAPSLTYSILIKDGNADCRAPCIKVLCSGVAALALDMRACSQTYSDMRVNVCLCACVCLYIYM